PVPAARHVVEPPPPDLAQLPLDLVPRHGVARGFRNGEPQARIARIVLTLEPIQDEEARRGRASLPVDGVEVSRTRQAVSALHLKASLATPLSGRASSARSAVGNDRSMRVKRSQWREPAMRRDAAGP